MKKLLVATDSFLPRWDGIARFTNEVIPKLSDDFEIKVIAPNFKGDFEGYVDVEIVRIPISSKMIADYPIPKPSFSQVNTEVKEADIVWTQTIGPIGAIAIISGKRNKKKVVAFIHSIEWELFPRSLNTFKPIKWLIHKSAFLITKYLYNKCDLLLVPSDGIAKLLERKGIRTPKKIVPLGVDTKVFSPPIDKDSAKKDLGIDPRSIVIGFAGRIGLEKDIATLYRAFGRIHRKHNTILLIVGQDLGGITSRFKSNPKVKIFGSTNNIAPFLQAMDIYVLPSLTETSSLSTLEAMSTQLAVICTPVGSVKDYVKEGFNGLLFTPGSAYELASKMNILLTDTIFRKRLAENARRTVISRFSWDRTVSEIAAALKSI